MLADAAEPAPMEEDLPQEPEGYSDWKTQLVGSNPDFLSHFEKISEAAALKKAKLQHGSQGLDQVQAKAIQEAFVWLGEKVGQHAQGCKPYV